MQTQVLTYRIIVEPEKQGKKVVYNAYCPTLGVADYGNSIDEVLESIKDGINLAVKYLVKEGKQVPVDSPENGLIATAQVNAPAGAKLSFA